MAIKQVYQKYRDNPYVPHTPPLTNKDYIFPEGHVFDKERSVRWNKEHRLELEQEFHAKLLVQRRGEAEWEGRRYDEYILAACEEAGGVLSKEQVVLAYAHAWETNLYYCDFAEEFKDTITVIVNIVQLSKGE